MALSCTVAEFVWNVIAHAQKPNFVFRRNGRVHLNRQGHQFSRLLAAEVCASAVLMLDTPCSEVVWRVLATHSICQFPLHFPSRASPWAITFQTQSNINEEDYSIGGKVCVSRTIALLGPIYTIRHVSVPSSFPLHSVRLICVHTVVFSPGAN